MKPRDNRRVPEYLNPYPVQELANHLESLSGELAKSFKTLPIETQLRLSTKFHIKLPVSDKLEIDHEKYR